MNLQEQISRIQSMMGIIKEGEEDSYTTKNNNKIYFGKNTLFEYIDIPSGTKFTMKGDKVTAWGGSLEFTCDYFGVVNFDNAKGYKRFRYKGKSYWSKDLQSVLKSKFCVGSKTKDENVADIKRKKEEDIKRKKEEEIKRKEEEKKELERKKSMSCSSNDCWTELGKESYWNGIGAPKITISESDSEFIIDYEGETTGYLLKHAKGGKGDTVHQLCNVLTLELNSFLSKGGLKPDLNSIEMTSESDYFKISVPLLPVKDKTFRIERRGGWGHSQAAGKGEMESKCNLAKGCDELVTKISTGPIRITEHFITYEV
jgi:hypothetical protein